MRLYLTPGLFAPVLAAAIGLFPRAAWASPTYPPVVRDTVGMTCTPQCIVCHDTNEGGRGKINAFADLLVMYGAYALNDDSVRNALREVQKLQPPPDTDGDGIDDLTELKIGDLPAIAGHDGQGLACSNVKYGCGASVAPIRSETPPSLALLTAVLLWAGVRVRRRTRPRRPGEIRNDPCR